MQQILFHFQLEFTGYWHAGTGQGGAGDVDAVILRDARHLPYFPGKALKGLFSDACCSLVAADLMSEDDLLALFGREGGDSLRSGARLRFSNATLPEDEAAAIVAAKAQDGLVEILASTAIEDGLAKSRTLRRIEAAIPMVLPFQIALREGTPESSPATDEVEKLLRQAAERITMAGAHRHAGLGECRVVFLRREDAPSPAPAGGPADGVLEGDLLRLPFEIELLEDVILGENAATTGAHDCLDHLTGASLLGAFAATHYRAIAALGADAAFRVFHAGAVRFGDAHPLDSAGRPALPIPLSWHHRKNEELFDETTGGLRSDRLADLSIANRQDGIQYQQARGHWLSSNARKVKVKHRRLLKSARDTASFGRPAESQLFGYQAIVAGQRFGGEIHIRTDLVPSEAVELLKQWLTSSPRLTLGRSRSAEFGAVRLRPAAPSPATSGPAGNSLVLYALSDLCPTGSEILPQDGGEWHPALSGWRLNLHRTHARIREYSNWNGFRARPDPARRVISRGSVIVWDPPESGTPPPEGLQQTLDRDGLGTGLHLGLGRVLVNPVYPNRFEPAAADAASEAAKSPSCHSTLVRVAKSRSRDRLLDLKSDDVAKAWVREWKGYDKQPSPSQWSRIRQMATACKTIAEFGTDLAEMLDHGAAKKAWEGAKTNGRSLANVLTQLASDKSTWPKQVAEMEQDSAERLLLLAIAEAARQLRQAAKKPN